VSWFAACRFCNWLSEKEGRPAVYVFHEAKDKGGPPRVEMARPYEGGYRLPTEAEWEYAARAGTTTAFSFGEDDRRYGEHAHSYVVAAPSGAVGNDAVNARKPNPWGLYQMHGNAHEWCWDWYAPLYDLTRTQDPTGPDAGVFRVNRGGAMRLPPNYGRSAARMMDDPCATRYDLGFRVVCSPPATTRP
jgi:formylglycine-generating enzyme required for sulfatase activity